MVRRIEEWIYEKYVSRKKKDIITRQKNYCVKILRKESKNFFENLDTKKNLDTVIPFFSQKKLDFDQINLKVMMKQFQMMKI